MMAPGGRRLVFLPHETHGTRPLEWWAGQWKSFFRLSSVTSRVESLPMIYSNAGLDNQQWTCWESVE